MVWVSGMAQVVEERAEVWEQVFRVGERGLDRKRDRIASVDPREVGGAGKTPALDRPCKQGFKIGFLSLEWALTPVQHRDLMPRRGRIALKTEYAFDPRRVSKEDSSRDPDVAHPDHADGSNRAALLEQGC